MKKHHISYISYQKSAMLEEAHGRPHPMGDNPLLHYTAKTIIHSDAFLSLSEEMINTLSTVFNHSSDIYNTLSQFSSIDLSKINMDDRGRTDISLEYSDANLIFASQNPSDNFDRVSQYVKFLSEETECVQIGGLLEYYEELSKEVYPATSVEGDDCYDIDKSLTTYMMEMMEEMEISSNDLTNFTVILSPIMVSFLQSSGTFNYVPAPVGRFRGSGHLMKVGSSGNYGFELYSYIDLSQDHNDGQPFYIIYRDPSDPYMTYTPKYPIHSNIEIPQHSLDNVVVYISRIKGEDFVKLRPNAEKTVRSLKFKYE